MGGFDLASVCTLEIGQENVECWCNSGGKSTSTGTCLATCHSTVCPCFRITSKNRTSLGSTA
eukprot:CAMPEP_0204293920 /NCGR_PEP_ID=MMETSP0468-20130131/67030_1 /ASSEMBLY_ACC=CAM_ASM_000383 /TAXON_ID=2969 /ORGANISM="Oxyrrhis marina" /LENGTH=61 /DNA_ID=CAMNT_0051272415 /DNA_START=113 /DNA_END=295 /DNA_ORIENTATION=-